MSESEAEGRTFGVVFPATPACYKKREHSGCVVVAFRALVLSPPASMSSFSLSPILRSRYIYGGTSCVTMFVREKLCGWGGFGVPEAYHYKSVVPVRPFLGGVHGRYNFVQVSTCHLADYHFCPSSAGSKGRVISLQRRGSFLLHTGRGFGPWFYLLVAVPRVMQPTVCGLAPFVALQAGRQQSGACEDISHVFAVLITSKKSRNAKYPAGPCICCFMFSAP